MSSLGTGPIIALVLLCATVFFCLAHFLLTLLLIQIPVSEYLLTSLNPLVLPFTWPYHLYCFYKSSVRLRSWTSKPGQQAMDNETFSHEIAMQDLTVPPRIDSPRDLEAGKGDGFEEVEIPRASGFTSRIWPRSRTAVPTHSPSSSSSEEVVDLQEAPKVNLRHSFDGPTNWSYQAAFVPYDEVAAPVPAKTVLTSHPLRSNPASFSALSSRSFPISTPSQPYPLSAYTDSIRTQSPYVSQADLYFGGGATTSTSGSVRGERSAVAEEDFHGEESSNFVVGDDMENLVDVDLTFE
jgi:hypothetical protein